MSSNLSLPKKHVPNSVGFLPAHKIARSLKFQKRYQDYYHKETRTSLVLNNKTGYVYDLDKTSYRAVNHWDKQGLFLDKNREGGTWRRFSLVDSAWGKVIATLRELGLSIEKIRRVKESIFYDTAEKKIFEFFLASFLFYKEDSYILISLDGSAEMTDREDLLEHLRRFGLHSYLVISFGEILRKNFAKELAQEENPFSGLSESEKFLLLAVLAKDYESITVYQNKGGFKRFEKSKRVSLDTSINPFEQVSDILKKGNFKDIEVKQENGKIVSLKQTEKYML